MFSVLVFHSIDTVLQFLFSLLLNHNSNNSLCYLLIYSLLYLLIVILINILVVGL